MPLEELLVVEKEVDELILESLDSERSTAEDPEYDSGILWRKLSFHISSLLEVF